MELHIAIFTSHIDVIADKNDKVIDFQFPKNEKVLDRQFPKHQNVVDVDIVNNVLMFGKLAIKHLLIFEKSAIIFGKLEINHLIIFVRDHIDIYVTYESRFLWILTKRLV
jgi:hypothetical protein